MKRGALHFLGRKNQSLFDTTVPVKGDLDNLEFVVGSSAIPESGTASVRARPTVKHRNSSSESFQAFAVPTPKVPVLPAVNGPKTNGSVSGNHLSNGSVLSVPDLTEEEIFVPPPPSMAPPPPPGIVIPPPDFMGDLSALNLAALQPSLPPVLEGEDFTLMKPPAMAPPKPPSTSSGGSVTSVPISASSPLQVPERPTFAPPEPPSERQPRSQKKPPPKPMRLSSISASDYPPENPAPPPPRTPTLSTFNPQNAAKVYSVPQTSILSGYEEHDARPKQMLLLEDSASVNSAPVLVQVDGKAAKVASPSRPAPRDVQDLMQDIRMTHQPPSPLPEANKEAKTAQPEMDQRPQTPHQTPPPDQDLNGPQVDAEPPRDQPEGSPGQTHVFSPIIDCKLRNLKSSEPNGPRDAPVASPLALLMAAKERDKHKPSHTVSRENSTKTSAIIQPSDSSPNSFIITPISSSSSSLSSLERLDPLKSVQTPVKPGSPAPVKDQTPSVNVTPSLVEQKLNTMQSLSKSPPTQPEEFSMPLLPPPPEFDDFMEPPPSIPPPDPPKKKAPLHSPPHDPPPPPTLRPPAAPKLPPPDSDAKPRLRIPSKSPVTPVTPVTPAQLPATLSPSQATLLSILQKKMLEMDHKMEMDHKVAPAKEADAMSDDWGGPTSEEDNKVPVVLRASPQSPRYPAANKVPVLNMQELEDKMMRKTSPMTSPTSNGPQSKHQYGMTFTVRPGTKQPITVVSKGDP